MANQKGWAVGVIGITVLLVSGIFAGRAVAVELIVAVGCIVGTALLLGAALLVTLIGGRLGRRHQPRPRATVLTR